MAMEDYVDASGDTAFLEKNWPAVAKAWEFERTHDTDGDGIYDNSQGTGWVESWIPKMPHQEIYLALLDEEASGAMARLSRRMQKPDIAERGRWESEEYRREDPAGVHATERNVCLQLQR